MKWLAVVGLLLATAASGQDLRPDGSDPRLDGCEDARWVGRHDSTWGMRFTIPDGLVGFRNSPGCTYHGVTIPLSQPPYERDRYVDLFAGSNDSESAEQACAEVAEGRGQEVARGETTLAGRRGYFVRVELGALTIERRCFLREGRLGPHDYLYSFTLVTPKASRSEDQRTLASILSSFAWTPLER